MQPCQQSKISTNVPICKALSTTAVEESLKSNPRPISWEPNRKIATESSSGLPADGLALNMSRVSRLDGDEIEITRDGGAAVVAVRSSKGTI
ncbi:hypothetical protein PPACK8108_LOCUS16977 [Phakopsora pachyrhizi]|uniref:Uncharacterized protein n=1 Tax=Phakopsora pachyrhizi TaxID=170000 RepID=A0AAV0BDT4_PHAPC|nr:hypothetical protein PPACK8108_LOCUS16977 [Phakopsora pachyrhizi]